MRPSSEPNHFLMTLTAQRLLLAILLPLAAVARADVSPAPLFSDGAVLQRDKPVAIWGRADPAEKVSVTFAGQRREATTGADGRWIVYLDSLAASGQGTDLVIAGRNTVILRDVVVGEVWLCSGQSNMEFPVSRATNGAREVAAANFPLLRHVKIERTVAASAAEAVRTTGWKPATPSEAGAFTAVGYFFARELHQKTGVPIGLVHSSWGGTPIESWMSGAALAENPAFAVVGERWRQMEAAYPADKVTYDANLPGWTAAEATARSRGRAELAAFLQQNPQPRPPRGPGDPWTPAGLFNGMIHPLLPYAFRGVLWYQGETNATRAAEYHPLFTALITAWRRHFGQPDLAFYWVNLAGFDPPDDPSGTSFAFLREAQTRTLSIPNTGQAIAIDLGDPSDIHPPNKQEVGRRLAVLARNRIYGLVSDDTGPTLAGVTREGSALRVRFNHVGTGLIAADKPAQSLQLAGVDRVFHPASGRIERDTLLVSSPAVKEPVAVRYAWKNAPVANLYNGAGLPAVPFRSDNW